MGEHGLNPEEAKSRAARARQLLDDPLLKESLTANVNAAIAACASVKDEKEAWRACMTLKATMDTTKALASHVETAKIIEYNFKPTLKDRFGL